MQNKKCCIESCCNLCEPGRRYCREHYLERKRQQAKIRYEQNGRYMYLCTCVACSKQFNAWRKNQELCPKCRGESYKTGYIKNSYVPAGGAGYKWKHRRIAEETLQTKLPSNVVVHHMDGDPSNNDKSNLIVITRSIHNKLHKFLNTQRVVLEKSNNENIENCWNNLIVPMTTAWLETTSAKVIKLSKIGQSAAETLNDNSQE